MIAWLVLAAALGGLNHLRQGCGGPPEPRAKAEPADYVRTAVAGGLQAAGTTAPRFEFTTNLSLSGDYLPRLDVGELRPRAGIDATATPSAHFRAKFDGYAEALVADRSGRVVDAGIRVRDAWIETGGAHADIRAGYGRIVWGRLDEIQPTDVINPVDTARFIFDGRTAARLPVAFVNARWFASEKLVVEGIAVPKFRRGSFDELDEPTSPFNLFSDVVLPAFISLTTTDIERLEPTVRWSNMSGGGRVKATAGRVDFAMSAYRGFEGFGITTFEPEVSQAPTGPAFGPQVVGHLVERFPRFTMIGGDFETVRGEWAIRGEAAMFVEKTLTSFREGSVDGRAFDAGVGFDRRAGSYRLFASLLLQRQWSIADAEISATNVSLVGSIERQFARDKYLVRAFGVVNASDASGFIRGLTIWKPRDNVAFEFSAAAFIGTGDDNLSRFKERDFLLSRAVFYW